jgi:hypothetical protein
MRAKISDPTGDVDAAVMTMSLIWILPIHQYTCSLQIRVQAAALHVVALHIEASGDKVTTLVHGCFRETRESTDNTLAQGNPAFMFASYAHFATTVVIALQNGDSSA